MRFAPALYTMPHRLMARSSGEVKVLFIVNVFLMSLYSNNSYFVLQEGDDEVEREPAEYEISTEECPNILALIDLD